MMPTSFERSMFLAHLAHLQQLDREEAERASGVVHYDWNPETDDLVVAGDMPTAH